MRNNKESPLAVAQNVAFILVTQTRWLEFATLTMIQKPIPEHDRHEFLGEIVLACKEMRNCCGSGGHSEVRLFERLFFNKMSLGAIHHFFLRSFIAGMGSLESR
jgi:hypothetical protein